MCGLRTHPVADAGPQNIFDPSANLSCTKSSIPFDSHICDYQASKHAMQVIPTYCTQNKSTY